MPRLRMISKLVMFLLWCMIMVPVQMIIMLFKGSKPAYTVPWLWHKGVCRILGLKVIIEGTPATDRQVIFVSNHLSYLDIPVIGSTLKASFVAKGEVASWPVFGFLSKLQQTAFITRARTQITKDKNNLENMMKDGRSMIIFPEGTSTDGQSVVPFKSSLFSIALTDEKADIWLQPFTLSLIDVDGRKPSEASARDLYAWYGDMTLPPHLSAFAAGQGATVKLRFHDPIRVNVTPDRKVLSQQCYEAISGSLNTADMAFAA